jgi:hypothetical protein
VKVLVATTKTQGLLPGDFTFCVPGELVIPPSLVCDADWAAADPDVGGCGCGRAFVGLSSAQGTTTAEVRELDMDLGRYVSVIRDSLTRQGWDPGSGPPSIATQLKIFAGQFPVGTVVRFRLDALYVLEGETR